MSAVAVVPVVGGNLTTVLMAVNAAAQGAAAVPGWHMVDGSELGVSGALLANGIYTNANARAIVAVSDYNGHRTLAIGFQGSNDAQDWRTNFQNINSHYALYEPLIAAIDDEVAAGRYDLILSTGHSLGGAMAQMFMADYAGIAPAYSLTTGSPGYLQAGPVVDDRAINYQISDDPVVMLGDNRAQAGQILASLDALTLTLLANAVGNALGFPAEVVLSSVPLMTQNYHDWGTNLILPVPGHPSTPPPVQSLLTGVNVDAHALTTYIANIGLVNANPFDLTAGGQGAAGDDALFGTTGDDVLDGGSGTDALYLHGNRSEFSIVRDASSFRLTSATSGADAISNIERVHFADERLAFDLGAGQAAGNTVRVIGAAFGAPAVALHADWVGVGLQLFDSGATMGQVCASVAQLLGLSDAAFVTTVYSNLTGAMPSPFELDYFAGLLRDSGGPLTQGNLLELAANTDLNALNVDLVGLQDTGVVFA